MVKKKKLDDEDFDEDFAEEADALDEEAVSADEPVEAPAPRGRNTGLTIFLCLLNVVAALAFTFLLVMDFQKRQEWSYAVFMNEFMIQGLPLQEEDAGPSASRATFPRMRLDSDLLKLVASQRGVKGSGEFWAVDEPFPHRIQAQHLSPEILKDYFAGQGAEVKTLEDEVRRLKDQVPNDITQVARDSAAAFKGKDDAAKRQFASKLLLPLAYDIYQVEKLDKKLKDAKGLELDALIEDGIQRRLLMEILAPCEIFRPGDPGKPLMAKVGDIDTFKLEELKRLLRKRFDVAIADKFDGEVHQGKDWDGESRHSWEKRQTIGFLLVALACVQKPDLANPDRTVPLYPDTGGPPGTPNLLRAQTVLGLYEFAAAAQNLPLAWRSLEERVLNSIQVDRQGFDILYKDKDGKERPARNQAFVDKYDSEIRRLTELVTEIRKADERLKDLREQNKTVQQIFQDREAQLKDRTKELIAARAETARQVNELRDLQQQLYRAQAELRDAAERNFRLEQDIRAKEREARGLKGAKAP